ncbi:aspartyl-tRNA synthetase [Chitinophaga costaii]|uniref:Aspartate--tRNA ligase n=1 Tax=Chitinophaga costaii TaxID=1335309 RepID=A0A1C4F598_9BACT|nr:aspartate--tRNA ligase [Chitinophaga costaii]PUZ22064.1 aspartate--tRNA ligase [Chitinophaga costaii]SCC50833.1 aspartyl-tRNA synthetase [Chitinophaga costaii]
MYRTHTCGELRIEQAGTPVTLSGWVQTVRKFGSINFVDLRDRYGITQLLFNESLQAQLDAQPLGREFVIAVSGTVAARTSINKNIPTGDIEVIVTQYTILNAAKTPPFTIQDDTDGGDELRMKFRYLDLRRNLVKQNLELRYRVNRATRNFLDSRGFMEIETPFLIKSTPEGARDFVVPSRMNTNEFYALPQSPQTFKQLLMVSGYDRYFQVVKCFRDEDLRADRQPEFTQIDCEMSFVEQEDILNNFEDMLKYIFREIKGLEFPEAFPRMTFDDAMEYYGNDKPDIRFDMKLVNLTNTVKGHGFKVFDEAEVVLAINATGCAEYTRKQLDELTDWVKRPQIGMSGLIYARVGADGSVKSSVDKFFDETQLKTWATLTNAQPGDLILVVAGREEKTRKAASELRLEMGERLGLRDKNVFKPLWVIDFPLFEYAEEEKRWVARHHPFTSPKPEHIALMDDLSRYAEIKANAYDIVLNGTEVGGGSIRIFQRPLQEKMFAALGMSPEEAQHKFGFLLGAFEYGAPPHGGIAFGLDRLCALLGGSDTIRDFIAFPKNNSGRDVMLDAPSAIDEAQLNELKIDLVRAPKA